MRASIAGPAEWSTVGSPAPGPGIHCLEDGTIMAREFKPGGRFQFLISAESDLPPAPIKQRYLVFSQQRTGSTLLTETLVESGQAGVPTEYFNPDMGAAIWKRIGSDRPWAIRPYVQFLERNRTTANGVFGFKAHLSQFEWAMRDDARRQAFLGRYDKVILSYRRDKLAQAVSFQRAMAGGPWFLTRERERSAPKPAELDLNVDQVMAAVASFVRQEDRQREMVRRAGLPLLELPYERLDSDFTGAMRDVFEYLDLPASLADGLTPPLKKLRDDSSARMIERVLATLRDSDLRRQTGT
jgi:LPS sulfotransferase NodH